MDVRALVQELNIKDPAACFALKQLCSTEYLAAGSIDEEACIRLLVMNLCARGSDGFWRVTVIGKTVCEHAEKRA
jgi:hypothetical protein